MTPLADGIHTHNIDILTYTDDTQLILSISDKTPSIRSNFNSSMTEVATWIKSNCLKLNKDKTKVVIFEKYISPWDSTWLPRDH